MNKFVWLLGCAPFLLSACGDLGGGNSDDSSEFIPVLSDGLLAIAAPYQDLKAVQIDPATGCYIYRHVGPVETTFLPLKTVDGRPICSQQSGEPPVS